MEQSPLDMNGMAVFVAVAETGSLTAAGRQLNLPKATVSRRLKSYEAVLGVTLFRRSTRSLSLTDMGQRHLQRIRPLVHEAREAVTEVREQREAPSGLVRISTSVIFGEHYLAPVIWNLARSYPNLRFDLVLTNALVDIVREGIDFAIRMGEPEDSELIGRVIGRARQLLVASPDCMAQYPVPESIADLDHLPTIVSSSGRRHWSFANGEVYRCNWKVSAGSIGASLDACLHGLGVTLVPETMARPHLESGALVRVLADCPLREVPITLLYPRMRHQSMLTRVLVDALKDVPL
ncbi:LysR family transcriptional regulator [Microbulbifer halophilus]|uniref:LysR family transcriptional regulator n=1 Tax=Microbulbifer halophilus TaxID=453963 RepID=A0ABW5EBS0_9GAMM|nr:LysR family transcriptional regulator [Microbulbifer halophilus]MCW8126572.1 LysR family transcriptional regulator [Microbulbifer halophilus]